MSIPQSGGGPIEDFAQLAQMMADGCKPKSDWRIGTEHEKFGFLTDTRAPLPYAGDRSISALFQGLTAFGWTPVSEGGNIIGMTRDGANISLEPGGQFELSGAAVANLNETAAELQNHLDEVKSIAAPLGLSLIHISEPTRLM
jgi:glutamate--cysteine ligase